MFLKFGEDGVSEENIGVVVKGWIIEDCDEGAVIMETNADGVHRV
jgi:hypothetical protein